MRIYTSIEKDGTVDSEFLRDPDDIEEAMPQSYSDAVKNLVNAVEKRGDLRGAGQKEFSFILGGASCCFTIDVDFGEGPGCHFITLWLNTTDTETEEEDQEDPC